MARSWHNGPPHLAAVDPTLTGTARQQAEDQHRHQERLVHRECTAAKRQCVQTDDHVGAICRLSASLWLSHSGRLRWTRAGWATARAPDRQRRRRQALVARLGGRHVSDPSALLAGGKAGCDRDG